MKRKNPLPPPKHLHHTNRKFDVVNLVQKAAYQYLPRMRPELRTRWQHPALSAESTESFWKRSFSLEELLSDEPLRAALPFLFAMVVDYAADSVIPLSTVEQILADPDFTPSRPLPGERFPLIVWFIEQQNVESCCPRLLREIYLAEPPILEGLSEAELKRTLVETEVNGRPLGALLLRWFDFYSTQASALATPFD
jgi:hypothetical protein